MEKASEQGSQGRYVKVSYAMDGIVQHSANTIPDWAGGRVTISELKKLFKRRGCTFVDWDLEDAQDDDSNAGCGFDKNDEYFWFELTDTVEPLLEEADVPLESREFTFSIDFTPSTIEKIQTLLIEDWHFATAEFNEVEMTIECIDGQDRSVWVSVEPAEYFVPGKIVR